MRKYMIMTIALGLIWACSNNNSNSGSQNGSTQPTAATGKPDYDSARGKGKFSHVDIGAGIDPKMVAGGKSIYDVKCAACHKLTEERLVGPGWSGVTERRRPEWIMNFVTNTDEMIDKDPHAQALLEICMVRMPNQHLSDEDARNVLEFMRSNDKKK